MSYKERFVPQDNSEHNKIAIITGVSGSGKDFLVDQAQKQTVLPSDVTVFNYGQEIFDHLREEYPTQIETRDDLKKLSPGLLMPAVNKVAERILSTQPALVNAHMVVQTDAGVLIRPDLDRKLKASDYLFIWTDPAQVKEWREKDTNRKRLQESVDDISFFQDFSMEIVEVMAKKIGAGFNTVWNRTDNVIENLSKLGDIVRKVSN